MGDVRRISVAVIVALLIWPSMAPRGAEPDGAVSTAEIGSRYAKALAQRDTKAYVLLVCWDQVLPQERKSLESGFTSEASNTISDVRFLTIEQLDQEVRKAGGVPPTRRPVKRGAVTYDFNLPVIGYLTYQFKSQDGKMQGTGAVPVGMKGGRYFVTTRAPLP
jgi:hypothetical protein